MLDQSLESDLPKSNPAAWPIRIAFTKQFLYFVDHRIGIVMDHHKLKFRRSYNSQQTLSFLL